MRQQKGAMMPGVTTELLAAVWDKRKALHHNNAATATTSPYKDASRGMN